MEFIGGLGGSGGFLVWLIAGDTREKGALLFLRCSGDVVRKQ
jgi:hypothetical protein